MNNRKQLEALKGYLENFELFIREIEETIELMDSSSDPQVIAQCRIRMCQLQQNLAEMSKLNEDNLISNKKFTS